VLRDGDGGWADALERFAAHLMDFLIARWHDGGDCPTNIFMKNVLGCESCRPKAIHLRNLGHSVMTPSPDPRRAKRFTAYLGQVPGLLIQAEVLAGRESVALPRLVENLRSFASEVPELARKIGVVADHAERRRLVPIDYWFS
jgi:hypothetical protein